MQVIFKSLGSLSNLALRLLSVLMVRALLGSLSAVLFLLMLPSSVDPGLLLRFSAVGPVDDVRCLLELLTDLLLVLCLGVVSISVCLSFSMNS